MDAKVDDDFLMSGTRASDDFLLHEGLEVLAAYRSIRNDAVRLVVKEMIAAMAKATDTLPFAFT